jgi:DNA invertase Pin-like site-specific DNA recombinase
MLRHFRTSVMHAIRFIAYYRVSTARQGRSGLGLDAQREAVRAHAAGMADLLAEFTEIESGRRSDRPELAKALAACRLHRAILVIAKLDRLARNVAFISALLDSGVEFVATDMPAANRLTVHILAAVAENEARMISERTKAALAATKRRGIKLGGFRGRIATDADRKHAGAAKSELANARARDLADTVRHLQAQGVTSYRAIAGRLTQLGIPTTGSHNRLGHPTGHGGEWTGVQVGRVIARLNALSVSS